MLFLFLPTSNSHKYICEKCRRKIPKNDLEEIFQTQLKNLTYSSDPIERLMSDAELQIKEKEKLLQTLQAERKRVQDEMDKLFKLHVDGEIPKKGFGRRYNPLEERIQNIEKQIPELQGELDYLRISKLTKKQVMIDSKGLHSRWSKFKEEEKRKIIETIIEKIVIGEDEITISLKHLPLPLK